MAGITKAKREARAAAAASAEQGTKAPQDQAGEASNEGAEKAAELQAKADADASALAAAQAADEKAHAIEAELTAALAALPGEYTDAEYVVSGMRKHFGEAFTDVHEAFVREVVVERAPAVQLVPMVRSADDFPEPHTADVHPDEVANYAAGGWQQA